MKVEAVKLGVDSSLHPPFQLQRYISLLLRHREKTPFILFVQRFLSLMKLVRNLRLGLFTPVYMYYFKVSAAVFYKQERDEQLR